MTCDSQPLRSCNAARGSYGMPRLESREELAISGALAELNRGGQIALGRVRGSPELL